MSDNFGDSQLLHHYFGAMATTANKVFSLGVEPCVIELLEVGISAGVFTGGSPYIYAIIMEVAHVNSAGFFSVSKGTNIFSDPINGRVSTDNSSHVIRFKRREHIIHLSPYLLNPAGYRQGVDAAYKGSEFFGLQLRMSINGTPDSITHVTGWLRYRELEEPSAHE